MAYKIKHFKLTHTLLQPHFFLSHGDSEKRLYQPADLCFPELPRQGYVLKKKKGIVAICFSATNKSSSIFKLSQILPEYRHAHVTVQLHLKIIRLITVLCISGQERSLDLPA